MTHFEIDPPYDELAERAVLGAMILDPEVIPQVLEYLREEDFYIDNHRLLFSLLYKLWEDKGKDWDDIVLREYINRYGLKDKIDMSFIYALVDEAAKGALLQEAINLVKEKSGLRSLMDLSFNTLRGIKEEPDFNRLLDFITHRVLEISEKQTISHYHHIREVANKVIDIIEKHRKEERLITGRATGFLDLDILTTGLHPSDLVIVAARPGMGKSSFMLSMAINMAMEEKVPVIIYSLEMSKEQLTMRALSMLSGVPLQNMRRGFIKEEERSRLIGSALELSRCEIYIDDTPTLSTTDLRIKTRKLKKERGVQVAFIDYLQLLRPPVRKSSRQEEVAEISRNLKALAKELSIPVVALAQLSRQVEHRSDKRPQLADLRECLSGDTLIIDAQTGISYTVKDLYESGKKIKVYSLDVKTLKIISKPVERVVFSGYKEVYELRTKSGRSIKASNNHPFLTPFGWKELKDIEVGDYIAVPEETLSDIFFDELIQIEPVGIEPTYDLVIPDTHNFVANHIIVHNSGQIEQDADLIIFIHRPEYYKKNPPPEEQGIAEIIVAKQRQGPTGIIKVAFMKDTASFKSLESSHMQKIESYEPDLEDFSEEDYDLDF